MAAPEAQRYVDLDLRIDPALIGVAVEYARQYIGDWDVMIAARELALATGNLPIPVARMVLNVARCDARWCNSLPAPRHRTYVGAFPDAPGPEDTGDAVPVAPEATERPRRRLRSVKPDDESRYRLPYDLVTRWKRRYGVSGVATGGKQRRVWHVLDPERSRIRYFPHPEAVSRYHTSIYWVCGSASTVPVLLADPPDDLPMCKTCQRLLEDPEYDEFRQPMREWWLAEQERLTAPEST